MRILNKNRITRHGNEVGRRIVADLLDVGLDSIDPYNRVKSLLSRNGNVLRIRSDGFTMTGDPHTEDIVLDLDDFDRIFVIGAAKGVQRAGIAFEDVLGDRLTGGHLIAKHGEPVICKKIGVTLAGHPVPDEDSVKGCEEIERIAKTLTEKDLVFTVTGSGVSSLMTYPVDGVTLKDIADFTRMMQIEKGVPTSDLNPIRTHLDKFKGGRLSRLLRPARLIHLTTADPSKKNTPAERFSYYEFLKINTFLPTIANGYTFADCIKILEKWDAVSETPKAILDRLYNGRREDENMSIEEFDASGDRFFGLIFKNATIYPAVRKRAEEYGLKCVMLSEYVEAEAREAAKVDASIALNIERTGEPFKAPIVLMSSGENVVTVGKERGVGGRNQEYCLQAAVNISGSRKVVMGAVDTDGTDGPGGFCFEGAPSCLAGAIVDGYTLQKAKESGIDISSALKTHGTSEPLWKLDCGVSATANVSALDLRVILVME